MTRCKARIDGGLGPRCLNAALAGNYGYCGIHRRPRQDDDGDVIQFHKVTVATLLQLASRPNAYAGGTHQQAIQDYIHGKRIDRLRVKYRYRKCHYVRTTNVMRLEDRLLARSPDMTIHKLSNLQEAPGFCYVLTGLR